MPAPIYSALCVVLMGALAMTQPAAAEETETPEYEVVAEHEGYEIRVYGPLIMATVESDGRVGRAMNDGFRPLANFIFGGNEGETEIAMTAPVIAMTEGDAKDDAMPEDFRVAFIMPSKFKTLDDLPTPKNDRVKLQQLDGLRVAAVRFSGMGSTGTMENKWRELEKRATADGYERAGAPILAKYVPPWTLTWNRRNEVLIPVAKK